MVKILNLVKNLNGVFIDFDASINYMDDELVGQLYDQLAPCTVQEFFTAYENAHELKFGTPWELSKSIPQWWTIFYCQNNYFSQKRRRRLLKLAYRPRHGKLW